MHRLKAHLPLLLIAVSACSPSAPGVTGTWQGSATDPHGQTVALTLSLEAEGGRVTGRAGPPPLDEAPAVENGTIAGDQVSFRIGIGRRGGDTATFAFALKVAGDRMQGTITNVQEGQSIPFTATRTSGSPAVVRPSASGSDTLPPNPRGSDPTPQEAQAATLAAFARYEVVGLGILSYASQDYDDFILALLRNPALPGTVNDIVVECGNALYQPVLDRYIAGEDVALREVQQVWRNTTQPFCGVNTFYEELFPLVRRINRGLPPGRRLRVLAGDPPVDWSKVRTQDELRPLEDRDGSIAGVMETQVLAKHRKALMIFGVLHLMHGRREAVGRYEAAGYPGVTYVIMPHNGFGNHTPQGKYNDELERRMASWPVPSLVPLKGTWLDDLAYGYFFPDERGGRISERVDGYLYLGRRDVLLNQPIPARVVLDKAYMAELQRRADVRGGEVGSDVILQEAADSGVFFYGEAQGAGPVAGRGRVTRRK